MIMLLAPEQGEVISGGYRYNRRLAESLPEGSLVYRHARTACRAAELFREEGMGDADAVLLDSLFFSLQEELLRMRELLRGRLWMLVHYLPSMDPSMEEAERSAMLESEEKCLSVCDGAVATGTHVRREIERRYPDLPVVLAEPGTDRELFDYRSEEKPENREVLTVGNWTPLKNYASMLPVFAGLKSKTWRWRIVGDSGVSPALRRQFLAEAGERKIGGRILLDDAVPHEEVVELMRRAGIYLHPALMESYGMSVAEAMAAGCAVIAADTGGPSGFITSGIDGILCSPGEPFGWKEALLSLMENPSRRETMGRAARQTSMSFPRWADTAERVLSAIEKGGGG